MSCEAEPQSCLPKGRRLHGAAALRHVPVSKNVASCLKIRAAFWSGHGRQLVLCEAQPQSCLPKGRRLHGAAALRHVPVSKNVASCLKTRAVYWSAQGWHLVLCEAEPQSCLPKGRRLHGAAALRHVPVSKTSHHTLKTESIRVHLPISTWSERSLYGGPGIAILVPCKLKYSPPSRHCFRYGFLVQKSGEKCGLSIERFLVGRRRGPPLHMAPLGRAPDTGGGVPSRALFGT